MNRWITTYRHLQMNRFIDKTDRWLKGDLNQRKMDIHEERQTNGQIYKQRYICMQLYKIKGYTDIHRNHYGITLFTNRNKHFKPMIS